MIFEIACPLPLHKTFDYKPPAGFSETDPEHLIGRRVRIPFGPKQLLGLITGVKDTSFSPAEKLKTVLEVIDADPLLSPESMELGRWLSDNTLCSLGEALFALFPPGRENPSPLKDPSTASFHDELHAIPLGDAPALTNDQTDAARRIHEAIYTHTSATFLLHGVAAAGKTEVYLSAIKDALAQGKSALYLVPEIGLSHQAYEVLKARFGEKVIALWHSDMPEKRRREEWWRIKRGDVSIVVGPRSAALVPLPHVGVFVLDEEHDTSYKEDRKPRFHAREVVSARARQSNGVVVLGSATPSMESFFAAKQGDMILVELKERAIPAATPQLTLVDVSQEKKRGALSARLEQAMGDRLKLHEQSILFLNKRGFHRFLRCPSCSWVAQCPQCTIALVQHKAEEVVEEIAAVESGKTKKGRKKRRSGLWCHYCSYTLTAPAACPQCGNKKLYSGGYGTQRVAEEVQQKYPWARVLRWDRDSVSKQGAHERIYKQFSDGEGDILVGTQMVAQGFNFPKATLVGVIDADVPLYVPDFRAAEKTFQLITQVAGRAGRALVTGEVIIQTRHSDHYALKHAAALDYAGFSDEELKMRESLNYPPFSHLIEVVSSSKNPRKAEEEITRITRWIEERPNPTPIGILGPKVARRTWTGGKTKFVILLKVPREIHAVFLAQLKDYLAVHTFSFMVDVDPETLH